ncbi:MAG: DUF6873 family GME fold protein [Bacteroidota bacterium]
MWAIIDSRAPKKAIEKLKEEFDVFEFKSSGITYEQVSGHPDIFICQDGENLIIAPNSPKELIKFLEFHNVKYSFGEKEVGIELNNSTQYNCIATNNYLIHKKGFTDKKVISTFTDKKVINLPQAYTRCSLSAINDNNFISSDRGIEKSLTALGFNVLLVDPKSILLPGFPYGFFGGTNGIHNSKFYLIGSLKHHPEGEAIRVFLLKNNIEIIELYDGPLYDGGGIFFGI